MKTIIKIHDAEWFKEHCKVIDRNFAFTEVVPSNPAWNEKSSVSWLLGDSPTSMGSLAGRELEVEIDGGIQSGSIAASRYMVEGYWIPNWAIEWVKEE